MYNCPRCGNPIYGSYDEGGIKWAICEDCHKEDRKQIEKERFDRDYERCLQQGNRYIKTGNINSFYR